ncbi:MAG: hypothetical protein INQ03_22720 [Candidatus Heimdallarchaeota archaeon]|nr:hypothetical protein [Candidatus Heimdallarchaeota archaeon]
MEQFQQLQLKLIEREKENSKVEQKQEYFNDVEFKMKRIIEQDTLDKIVTYIEFADYMNKQPNEETAYVNFIYIGTTDVPWSMKLHHAKDDKWFFDIPYFEVEEFTGQVFTSCIYRSMLDEIMAEYFSKQEMFYYFQENMINNFLRYCGKRWGIMFTGYDINFLLDKMEK